MKKHDTMLHTVHRKAFVMGKGNVKPIEYHKGIFDVFKNNPYIDRWDIDHFPEIMWGLGYDMDSGKSFEKYVAHSPLKVKDYTNEREKKRNALYYLEHADKQIIGNYLFSNWRYLTHWSLSGYTEYDVDFLCRIIIILEDKYEDKEFKTIDEYVVALDLPKMDYLGEDQDCKYYIEHYLPGFDEEVGIPTVITEIMHPHTFSVCDADTAMYLMNYYL